MAATLRAALLRGILYLIVAARRASLLASLEARAARPFGRVPRSVTGHLLRTKELLCGKQALVQQRVTFVSSLIRHCRQASQACCPPPPRPERPLTACRQHPAD